MFAPSCLKADVCEDFGFKKKESYDLDESKLCDTNVKYSGNTTNLRAHLKHHHRDTVTLTEDPKKLRPCDPKQTMLDDRWRLFPQVSICFIKVTENDRVHCLLYSSGFETVFGGGKRRL